MRNVMALMCLGVITAAHAQGVCTKPDTPACATGGGPFSGEAAYDECRKQMIAYKAGMEAYAACLDESEWPADGLIARTELESSLARFNRRARGEQD